MELGTIRVEGELRDLEQAVKASLRDIDLTLSELSLNTSLQVRACTAISSSEVARSMKWDGPWKRL